jgi:hypothetical protein
LFSLCLQKYYQPIQTKVIQQRHFKRKIHLHIKIYISPLIVINRTQNYLKLIDKTQYLKCACLFVPVKATHQTTAEPYMQYAHTWAQDYKTEMETRLKSQASDCLKWRPVFGPVQISVDLLGHQIKRTSYQATSLIALGRKDAGH